MADVPRADDPPVAVAGELARGREARLGAGPDVTRLAALTRHEPDPAGMHGLPASELEVLWLLASGKTNHAFAVDLVLADKTVDRQDRGPARQQSSPSSA